VKHGRAAKVKAADVEINRHVAKQQSRKKFEAVLFPA
jgi:hypothetical protein